MVKMTLFLPRVEDGFRTLAFAPGPSPKPWPVGK